MNHLEFNKPHIQKRLRDFWAIETIQEVNQRTYDSMLTPSCYRIDTVYPILQNMIDNQRDIEGDIDQLNYIIYEVDSWILENGHHHPKVVQKVLTMIERVKSALWCE
jgi:hypothetical protein